jgi:hypothetical protein
MHHLKFTKNKILINKQNLVYESYKFLKLLRIRLRF